MIVDDCPSAMEDHTGERLSGASGTFLKDIFNECGVDIEDCIYTSAIGCHSNAPRQQMAKNCYAKLLQEIQQYKPRVIIPMGGIAIRQLITEVYKRDFGEPDKWYGFRIPDNRFNAFICPVNNPSYVMDKEKEPAQRLVFKNMIANAIDMEGKECSPLTLETLSSMVKTTTDIEKAISLMDLIIEKKPPLVSFDYETSGLKPYNKGHFIHSVSFAMGTKMGFAFPFFSDSKFLFKFRQIMENPAIGKIGANIKFEDKWTWTVLGFRPVGWVWDTVLASHCIDARNGTKSLKFQSFVRYGIPSYEDEVEKFLKAEGSNNFNTISKAPMDQLLKYNAMDAVLTYKLAMDQNKELK